MTACKPAIVVLAYNRPHSLARLCSSLTKADFAGATDVALVISIDGTGSREVLDVAHSLQWPFGEKRVIERKERLGWSEHALACGRLTQEYGAIVFLEDDLYVSAHFYEFAVQALDCYADDEAIAGISLLALRVNECPPIALPFYPLDDGSDVFFLQKGIPSGWAVSRNQWERFEEWHAKPSRQISALDDLPPRVLSWPETSLSKYFIKYLVESQRYIVFPRLSLSTNFGDPGIHIRSGSRLFQVPLESSRRNWRFVSFCDSTSVYDAFHEIVPDRLNALCGHFHSHDYAVDLYGTRDLTKVETSCVLTTRTPVRCLHSFGRELLPPELNVIDSIPGEGIWFCEKDSLPGAGDGEEMLVRDVAFFFPAVPLGKDLIAELGVLRSECLEKEMQIGLLKEHLIHANEGLALVKQQRDSARNQLRSVRGALKALVRAAIEPLAKGSKQQ